MDAARPEKGEAVGLRISWRTEAVSLALLAAMFAASAVTWPVAPDRIPVHWGMTGEPDRYGGRFEGLLAIPLMAVGIYVLMVLVPRMDPRFGNYQRFLGTYHVIRTSIVGAMAAIHLVVVLWARGVPVAVEVAVPVAIGVLFIVLGNYMGKLRSTWFVGIRTPWTLSSDLSWARTHRLGGKVFVATGLALVAAAAAGHPWGFYGAFAMGAAGLAWTVAYSYLVWRGDPARGGLAGQDAPDRAQPRR